MEIFKQIVSGDVCVRASRAVLGTKIDRDRMIALVLIVCIYPNDTDAHIISLR